MVIFAAISHEEYLLTVARCLQSMYIDLATCGLLHIFPLLFLVAGRNDERDFFYLF
jgi:hypothetical protein